MSLYLGLPTPKLIRMQQPVVRVKGHARNSLDGKRTELAGKRTSLRKQADQA
jgi:hypothetical protein